MVVRKADKHICFHEHVVHLVPDFTSLHHNGRSKDIFFRRILLAIQEFHSNMHEKHSNTDSPDSKRT